MTFQQFSAPVVNRKEQLKQIRQGLTQIQSGKLDLPLVALEYWGIEGIGKTSMLKQAKEQCLQLKLPFASIDFRFEKASADQVKQTASKILVDICNQLEHYSPAISSARAVLNGGASDYGQETLKRFVALLIGALQGKPLILMMDSTEYCPGALFDWLGKEFLALFLQAEHTPGAALFLAGRGPRVRDSHWSAYFKRATFSHRLDLLDFQATEEHIGYLPPDGHYRPAARFIYDLSNGHPYSTEMIIYELNRMGVKAETVNSQRQALAQRLYDEVIRRHVLADTPKWARHFVEVASIPRKFTADQLQRLYSVFPDRSQEILSVAKEIQWYHYRISDLQEAPHHVVYVRDEFYELEPTLRRLMHTSLAILRPDDVLGLHKVNRDYYREVGGSKATSVLEVLYHTAVTCTIQGESTTHSVKKILQQSLSHFNRENSVHLRELYLLKDLLRDDTELAELVGKEVMQDLIEKVAQAIRPEREDKTIDIMIEHFLPSEYRVGWYQAGQVVLPTERVYSELKFDQPRWRQQPLETGKAAFAAYLPTRAQDYVRKRRDLAIRLITNTAEIPWELLHDSSDFLCLSRPFARKPQMLSEPRPNLPLPIGKKPRALVVGNPTGDLPGAEEEAKAVAEILESKGWKVDLLTGDDATAAGVVVCISDVGYALLHYAGHGHFDSATKQGSLRFKGASLFADQFERFQSSPRFVFLSACKAGQVVTGSFSFRGEFMEGFATSVLQGGAEGCLGPMWPFDDGIAKDFALTFYRHLLEGKSFAESVRQARLAVRDRSPEFWAGWILYSDPTKTLRSLLRKEGGHDI
jgi:hypothetical protein